MLKDSIIHFGENLPEIALNKAFKHGQEADLCLVLGSSLTVQPACEVPITTLEHGGKLVIVNLQKTNMDEHCSLRIFAKTDAVMTGVVKHLGLNMIMGTTPHPRD